MRAAIVWLGVVGSTCACAPAHVARGTPAGTAAPVVLAVPAQQPASGWETGSWRQRLEADGDRTPIVVARADGSLAPGLAVRWRAVPGEDGAPCWRFRLRRPVAERIARDWSARLRADEAALAALFHGLRADPPAAADGSPGIRAAGDRLWLCTARPDPGLPVRLAHPSAWPRGALGDPGSLVRADGIDAEAAVARDAGELLPDVSRVVFAGDWDRATSAGGQVRRAAPWDGTWALWLDPDARWTSDPSFRRWLAREIDREDLVRAILGGHGEVALALVDDPEAALPEPPGVRPFSAGARPRLLLAHAADDRIATRLASRLKAKLAERGVLVELDPTLPAAGASARPRGSVSAVLFLHRPASPDPGLALLETLAGLAPPPSEAIDTLRARPFDPPEARRVRAAAVQWDLVARGRLVPLVKAHAGVVGALDRLEPAPGGRLLRGRAP